MPSNVNVLLVDDNPVVLDMLRKAFEPLAHVTAVRNGQEALESSAASAPDLIVTDYKMPQLDGRQLIQEMRTKPTLSRVPVMIMASKTDQNEKLGMLRDTVEDFLEKPFFLRDLVLRVKRVVDKISLEKMAKEAPSEGGGVRGSLAQMSTIDLLQSLELGRKSCRLVIGNGADSCEMFFTDGNVTHALYPNLNLRGDEAVYKTLFWTEGSWELDFNNLSNEQSTTRSTQGLLMEGLRLLDEANRDASEDNVLDG
jgi:CheY-like chemotaxis protein